MILHLVQIKWDDGTAVAYQTSAGRCHWTYCGSGLSYRDVTPDHFVAAIESLLGWDHPAAEEARTFARSAR